MFEHRSSPYHSEPLEIAMATHAHSTRTPADKPGLLRAGQGRLLCATVAQTSQAEVCSKAKQPPRPEFHDHLAKPGETVRHPGARGDITTIGPREGEPATVLPSEGMAATTMPPEGLLKIEEAVRHGVAPVSSQLATKLRVLEQPIEQTFRSEGAGLPHVDFADVTDLASLDLARLRHARRMASDAIDHLIALLDALDAADGEREVVDEDGDPLEIFGEGDPLEDAEDDGTAEPILGAPEKHPHTFSMTDWDFAPADGASTRRINRDGSQARWAQGKAEALNDGEAEPGYDMPEGDDERDGDGSHYGEADEFSLGWNETVSQLALGRSSDDGDDTALERAGRGFIRSGHDDAEDDDPAERDDEHGSDDGEDIGHFASDARFTLQPLTEAQREEIAVLAHRTALVRRMAHV